MQRGRLITIEGGEGVGKSVFTQGLSQYLSERNIKHIRTFEPGGTPTASALRRIFIDPPKEDPLLIEAEFCVVSAARAQHVGRLIRPTLADGTWVICDRFADSSRVYQGYVGGIASANVEQLIEFTCFGISPDLTFVLDCDTTISLERLKARGGDVTRYDEKAASFHAKVRQEFLELERRFPERVVLLDASLAPHDVLAQATARLKDFGDEL